MGSYNTIIDAVNKTKSIFKLIEKIKWKRACLADVGYGMDGTRSYITGKQKWTMIVRGKVAIVLCEEWAQRWREGGAQTWVAKGMNQNKERMTRGMAIDIPPKGWRKGIHLVTGYAPTTDAKVAVRLHFRRQME